MLFKVSNNSTGRSTHCGVLEFIAQEGHVYLPRWVRPQQPAVQPAAAPASPTHSCRAVWWRASSRAFVDHPPHSSSHAQRSCSECTAAMVVVAQLRIQQHRHPGNVAPLQLQSTARPVTALLLPAAMKHITLSQQTETTHSQLLVAAVCSDDGQPAAD